MTSVIIVTYNNADDISACLDSLPWGTHKLDVINSENNSRDKTREKISRWISIHPNKPIRLLNHQTNIGYARGVNTGLKNAYGERILLLGPDTQMTGEALSMLHAVLDQKSDVGIAAPQLLNFDGSIQPSCRRFPTLSDILMELSGLPRLFPTQFQACWKMTDFDFQTAMDVDQPEASCLLIRKKAANMVGPMDTRFPLFFNDVDWCRRFVEKGWTIWFAPEAKVKHKRGSSVKQQPIYSIYRSHQAFFKYFRKYASRPYERFLLLPVGFLLIFTGLIRCFGSIFRLHR